MAQLLLFLFLVLNFSVDVPDRLLQLSRELLPFGCLLNLRLPGFRQRLYHILFKLLALLLQNPFGVFRRRQQIILGLPGQLQRGLALLQIRLCHRLRRQLSRPGVLGGTANRAGLPSRQRLGQNAGPTVLQNLLLSLIFLV